VIMIGAAVEGYFRSVLPGYIRFMVGAGGICLIAHNTTATFVGFGLCAAGLGIAHFKSAEPKAP